MPLLSNASRQLGELALFARPSPMVVGPTAHAILLATHAPSQLLESRADTPSRRSTSPCSSSASTSSPTSTSASASRVEATRRRSTLSAKPSPNPSSPTTKSTSTSTPRTCSSRPLSSLTAPSSSPTTVAASPRSLVVQVPELASRSPTDNPHHLRTVCWGALCVFIGESWPADCAKSLAGSRAVGLAASRRGQGNGGLFSVGVVEDFLWAFVWP